MLTNLFYVLVLAGTFLAFQNWRAGLFLVVLVGALQDPVRKLEPGAPSYFVLSALPVVGATLAGLAVERVSLFTQLRRIAPRLYTAMGWLLAALVLAFIVVLQHGLGAWKLGAVGFLAYGSPLIAIAIGLVWAGDPGEVQRLMRFYCVVTAVMLIGTVLEKREIWTDWPALGTSTMGFEWVRHRPGAVIKLVAGFYRSPDTMGWHAATMVMLCLSIASRQRFGRAWPWLLLAAWGGLCLFLGGRRKTIMMPVVWILVMSLGSIVRGRLRLSLFWVLAAAVGGAILVGKGISQEGDEYLEYAASAPGELMARVEGQSLQGTWGTLQQSGFLGLGLGTATQGRQHLNLELPRAWQEDGVSKIMVELGVPGFILFAVFALTLLREIYATVRAPHLADDRLSLALVGLVVANACSFIISHQIYGDFVISFLTAFFIGVVLASRFWVSASENVFEDPSEA